MSLIVERVISWFYCYCLVWSIDLLGFINSGLDLVGGVIDTMVVLWDLCCCLCLCIVGLGFGKIGFGWWGVGSNVSRGVMRLVA